MSMKRMVFNGQWLPKLPRTQTRLETALESRERAWLTAAERRAAVDERTRRHYSWLYDEPLTRAAVKSGDLRVTEAELYSRYLDWLNDASITYLIDDRTGDLVRHLAPKRGNEAYARLYRRRLSELERGMAGLQFDEPLSSGRSTYRRCTALLLTFTVDQARYDCQTAWTMMTAELAKAKIAIKRAIGAAHIHTMTVREGTESGYPAPHMLLIIDRPVITFTWKGKHRLHSESIRRAIKRAWPHGFLDIEAVVRQRVGKRGVCGYLLKYLTKAVDGRTSNLATKTFAWQKLVGTRPLHVSKQLKDELARRAVRLDTGLSQSQHRPAPHYRYYRSDSVPLSRYSEVLTAPPPVLPQKALILVKP